MLHRADRGDLHRRPWRQVDAGGGDGEGPNIEDLNGDGNAEFVTYDNSFLYAFASYAESYAPPKIFRLAGTDIKDVTRSPEFQRPIRQMLLAQQSLADADMWHDNGFLGGWVAHKALVGEGADAWRLMLQNYNRNSDWALTDCAVHAASRHSMPGRQPALDRLSDGAQGASGGRRLRDRRPDRVSAASAAAGRARRQRQAPVIAGPTAPPPVAAASSSGGESVVMLKRDGENFAVPVTINNTITLDFLVDSGASDVSIPADVILTLIRAGTIQSSDFVGTRTYRLADGSTVPSTTLIIHKLKVGDREVENVMASVSRRQSLAAARPELLPRLQLLVDRQPPRRAHPEVRRAFDQ